RPAGAAAAGEGAARGVEEGGRPRAAGDPRKDGPRLGRADPGEDEQDHPRVPRQAPQGEEVMATLKMPFGKHRGKRIISVPTEYLHWLLDNNDEMDADVKKAVVQELERRGETVEQKEEPADEPKAQPAPAAK